MGRKKRKSTEIIEADGANGLGSLIRILLVAAICFAGIYFAMYHDENNVSVFNKSKQADQSKKDSTEAQTSDSLKLDKQFESCYVMICNASENGIKTTQTPTDNGIILQRLKNGTIVKAVEKGKNGDVSYYKLEDGSFLVDDDEYVTVLRSYTKLSGYVVITYLSATGVKLRFWANFDDDNVAKRVFVGDQVNISGKVVTQNGQEAYQTEDGYYMTTEDKYFDDHTEEASAEDTSAEESTTEFTDDTDSEDYDEESDEDYSDSDYSDGDYSDSDYSDSDYSDSDYSDEDYSDEDYSDDSYSEESY